ncbi:M23 family metallopeptidase [Granulicella paludicola]|uniref:M23 family metallopeptidase n=1 Tax=Granulicella paludicola TaxID=474951 RepID=UPI0021DF6F7D|nr:M23 family metallopeptidase [Granulicella paludicola]
MRKHYIVYISQAKDGSAERVSIPMKYVYVFLAAAVTGMFTIAGMAGSYARMAVKAEGVNKLNAELAVTRKDYQHLETVAKAKDVQAASLGALASEVSAIYGLTAGKLSHARPFGKKQSSAAADVAKATLKDDSSTFSDDSYYKSLDTFYALKTTAANNTLAMSLGGQSTNSPLGVRGEMGDFASVTMGDFGPNVPDMWPIMGPINSGFGQREDPVLGNGEGEFHKGVDIGSPDGTPVHAPASGRVIKAGMGNGYGREIEIDHGNGIVTVYGHLQGFNVIEGQNVAKGEVIGYVGHSGRVTGSHLHYEVQVRGTAVNPHKYLQTTMAQLGGAIGK